MANNEDPDEMSHKAAFYQGLHCLLIPNRSSGVEIYNCFEIITCNPFIYTMDHPDLTVSNET